MLNQSYRRLAEYYGFAIMPARLRKPRDKASVESGGAVVSRSALAPLRNQVFFSLADLNETLFIKLGEIASHGSFCDELSTFDSLADRDWRTLRNQAGAKRKTNQGWLMYNEWDEIYHTRKKKATMKELVSAKPNFSSGMFTRFETLDSIELYLALFPANATRFLRQDWCLNFAHGLKGII
jgi:hypothetical protein